MSEELSQDAPEWFDIGAPADFDDGEVAPVVADGIEIAVFRIG